MVFVVTILSEVTNNVNLLVLVIVVQIVDLLQSVETGFSNLAKIVMMEIKIIMIYVPMIAHKTQWMYYAETEG